MHFRQKNITQIAAGVQHTVVLTSDGDIYTFGSNEKGVFGVSATLATIITNNNARMEQLQSKDNHFLLKLI
jgi:alpha-tubulin suppressor-like RCC1 family protein